MTNLLDAQPILQDVANDMMDELIRDIKGKSEVIQKIVTGTPREMLPAIDSALASLVTLKMIKLAYCIELRATHNTNKNNFQGHVEKLVECMNEKGFAEKELAQIKEALAKANAS